MGLFDWLHCEMPFPEGDEPPDWMYKFQSKDTPEQCLDVYRLTEDGHLLGPDGQQEVAFSGLIEFCAANWQACCGSLVLIIPCDDAYRAREYEVLVDRGVVLRGPTLIARTDRPVDNVETFDDADAYERAVQALQAKESR